MERGPTRIRVRMAAFYRARRAILGPVPTTGRCDHCAAAYEPGARYCPGCGAVISWNTPTAEVPGMVPAFVLVHLPGGVVRKDALGKPLVRLGRGRDCEVRVDHPRVSRLHALVDLRGMAWHVSDAKSTGGTFLNDRPIHDPVPLRSGDTIRLGRDPGESVTMVFHLGA